MSLTVKPVPDTPLERKMLKGHAVRKGHKPDAVLVSSDGILWMHIYKCCGGPIPESVTTWNEFVPEKPESSE